MNTAQEKIRFYQGNRRFRRQDAKLEAKLAHADKEKL